MRSGSDDFWGNQSDWSARDRSAPTTRVQRIDASAPANSGDDDDHIVRWNQPPEGLTARLKRSWSNLLGSGANPTREHGIVRSDAAQAATKQVGTPGVSADMFDDLDDFDFTYGESFPTAESASPSVDTDLAHGAAEWDAELAPAPISPRARTSAGVDPLIVRLGVVALIGALLVPVLLATRGADTASLIESSSSEAAPPSTLNLLPAESATPATQATSTQAADAATPVAQLDPNDLPPAVPVNTEPTTAIPSDVSAEASSTDTSAPAAATTTPTGSAALEAAVVDSPAERVERNCAIDYEVVAGDFWIRIADGADVPLAELLEANGASATTPIFPGRSICLPAGSKTPAPPTTVATPTTAAPTTTAPPATNAPTTTAAPAPTTTAPPATTPSNTNATPEQVKQIIRDVWPDDLEERAIEIAYRESRFVPTAKNFCCYGIFQMYWNVHKSWLADLGITNDQQLYDPATNARAAYALYQRAGGWGPWGF